MITTISPDNFISEAHRWGVTQSSLIRVRMMQKGDYVYCRFSIPNTTEILQTIVSMQQYKEFEFINLGPISIPALWIDEAEELVVIKRNVEEINASITTSNRDKSLWRGPSSP